MRLSKNRIIAWIVLAVCAAGSVFGLGGMHLHKLRNDVLDVFSRENTGMYAQLDQAGECARVMADEARLYLGEDCIPARNMIASLAYFGSECSLDDRYAAYTAIQQYSDALYNAMYAKNMLDGERVKFKRAYDAFWECDEQIRRHPYRELAAQYNGRIASFPANLAASVAGAGRLNSFGAD